MKVLKFGGSSVGNSERIRKVIEIISIQQRPVVVVVSALQGVTDTLKNISESAARHEPDYRERLENLYLRHSNVCTDLLDGSFLEQALSSTDIIFDELRETLNGLFLLR